MERNNNFKPATAKYMSAGLLITCAISFITFIILIMCGPVYFENLFQSAAKKLFPDAYNYGEFVVIVDFVITIVTSVIASVCMFRGKSRGALTSMSVAVYFQGISGIVITVASSFSSHIFSGVETVFALLIFIISLALAVITSITKRIKLNPIPFFIIAAFHFATMYYAFGTFMSFGYLCYFMAYINAFSYHINMYDYDNKRYFDFNKKPQFAERAVIPQGGNVNPNSAHSQPIANPNYVPPVQNANVNYAPPQPAVNPVYAPPPLYNNPAPVPQPTPAPVQEKPDAEFDTVRKYKVLLDEGIITQEEFDTKKKELLNL